MKNLHQSQLAWAALALAIATTPLSANESDPLSRKPALLIEAINAKQLGNLEVAKEKFEAILAIDSKDVGAIEGLAAVNVAIKEANLAKETAVSVNKTTGALAEVALDHQRRFDEVSRAIKFAKQCITDGNYKRASEIIEGAFGALTSISSEAAQKLRDELTLTKQELQLSRDSGTLAAKKEVKKMADASASKLDKLADKIDQAEKKLRRGNAESIESAISDLDSVEAELGIETLLTKPVKQRLKTVKANAIARRALLAIENREMTKAVTYASQYSKLVGEDDPQAKKLQLEIDSRKNNPIYRSIDSPELRAKDTKVNELLVKGRARYLYGEYQGALDAYREVLQYQPNNSESKAYQVRIRELLSETSGQWNRGVTKGKLLELLDETWKLPEVFNRENIGTPKVEGNEIIDKMKSIRLPDGFIARDMQLDRALILLASSSQTYDPAQKGVSIISLDNENPAINLQLTNPNGVTVFECLDYICKRHGYSFSVSSGGNVEVRKDAGDSLLETEFFELTQAAVVKMTGQALTPTTIAPGATISPFGGNTTGAADSTSGSAQENAIKSFLSRSGVPFEPPSTLSFDGTRLIVTQSRKNLDRVRNIIRRYSDVKQVHIEAKFMEVEQKVLNELGVNWSIDGIAPGTGAAYNRAQTSSRSLYNVFATNNGLSKQLVINKSDIVSTYDQNPPPFPGTANFGTVANTFGGNSGATLSSRVGVLGSYDLNLFIRALEQESGSDLMSSPSLTVLDGKTALISVAQLLRYPQAYGDIQSNVGNGGGTVGGTGGAAAGVTITAGTPQDFTTQQVGVSLEVTPTVAADDSIALNLKPKVTEFEGFVEYGGTSIAISGTVSVSVPSGFFQPIFSVREVTTDVTVFDGATVVIGGLTREEVKSVEDKVPVLGSLPLIGAAFRSSGKSVTKRSLMVFVTANLVSPGGASLRSSHPGMRAGSTFSNPTLISPGGAVYREPIEAASSTPKSGTSPETAK